MTRTLDKDRSRGDRARSRRYLAEFIPAMAAYVVVLLAVTLWGHLDGHDPLRFAWAVLPAIPAAGIAWVVLRHVRRIDEYERRVLTEGLAVGFALAMIAAVTVGLLQAAGLALPQAGWIVYAVGMLGWIVGAALRRRT